MNDELASVRGVVDLPSHDALDQAQSFLSRQGYTTVRRAGNSLVVERRPSDQAAGQEAPKLTVSAVPQPGGGVRITVRGNDREGMQERQATWAEWAEALPKKPETQTDEPGDQQRTIETPEVPLPPPPRVASSDVPPPSPPPRRGSSRLLVGSLVGCGVLSILGVLLIGALLVGANVGMQKAKEQAQTTGEKGETKNAPSKQEADSVEFLPIVLRVSGDQGTSYTCMYNTEALEEGEVVSYTDQEH